MFQKKLVLKVGFVLGLSWPALIHGGVPSSLQGKLSFPKTCEGSTDRNAQIFISKDAFILYQTEAPSGAQFEFSLAPGTYDVVAVTESGCYAEKSVALGAKPAEEIQLGLTPTQTGVLSAKKKTEKGTNRKIASAMNPELAETYARNCPTCGIMNNFPNSPLYQGQSNTPWQYPTKDYPTQYPWWVPFSAMSYQNAYSPPGYRVIAGQGAGIAGEYYPGEGRVFAGKPNLYVEYKGGFEGKKSGPKKFLISAVPAEKTTWLASVPGQNQWKTTLHEEGSVEVRGVKYPYFYYDLRTQDSFFQDQGGFCGSRMSVLEDMKKILLAQGYAESEVKDFSDYWGVKLPAPAGELCVFPQNTSESERMAALITKPEIVAHIRTTFIVTQSEFLNSEGSKKFSKRPSKPWREHLITRAPASASGTKAPMLREWAVAFLLAD